MGSACCCSFPQDEVCTPPPCLSCSLCSLPRGHLQEVPPIHGRLQLPDEVLGREECGEAFRWDRDGEEEVHADGRRGCAKVKEAGGRAQGVPGDERGVHLAVRRLPGRPQYYDGQPLVCAEDSAVVEGGRRGEPGTVDHWLDRPSGGRL